MKMNHLSRKLTLILSFILLFFLTACGDGGTTSTPQKITVTFSLSGNAATTVGSVDLGVVLPDGFVLAMDNSTNQPTDAALSILVTGATFAANYIPATAVANGEVLAGIIKGNGFVGNANLVQITSTFSAGSTLPAVDDFKVTVVARDLNGVEMSEITAQVSINTEPVL